MTPPPGRGHPRPAVVLVAHGSRDPRAAAATEALTAAVARACPQWSVHASYLDHAGERPLHVLHRLSESGSRRAVVVPLLLTAAYHGKVDVPEVLREAHAAGLPLDLTLADVLGPLPAPAVPGPPPARAVLGPLPGPAVLGSLSASGVVPRAEVAVPGLLLDALVRRLPEADLDAVVLAAAGTRDAAARSTVEAVAVALGVRLGLPCTVAYASAAPPTAGEAVAALQGHLRRSDAVPAATSGPSAGAARVGVASYFLAPGRLYDAAMASAREAGAVVFAEPLNDVPDLVALTVSRAEAALCGRPLVKAA